VKREVLPLLTIQITVFWYAILVDVPVFQRRLLPGGAQTDARGSKFLQNIDTLLSAYRTPHPR